MNVLMRFGGIFEPRDNPHRVAQPFAAPGERELSPLKVRQFSDLTAQQQRTTIRDYMRRWPCDDGLFGEAINEHRTNAQIRSAWAAGDMDQFAKLCDTAFREYLGKHVQSHWDNNEETDL